MVQCLYMIARTGVFSVFDRIPATMEPTWLYNFITVCLQPVTAKHWVVKFWTSMMKG